MYSFLVQQNKHLFFTEVGTAERAKRGTGRVQQVDEIGHVKREVIAVVNAYSWRV